MPAQERELQAKTTQASNADIERIYHDWNEALSKNDAPALAKLYAQDVEFESPLVSHLMGGETGIIRGQSDLKKFFDILATRKPKLRRFHREGYFTDGRKVMWEYPEQTPKGQQMDFVEVMKIENGLIQKHRVYWGWVGFNVLKNDQYRH